jgi:hypothetical protein
MINQSLGKVHFYFRAPRGIFRRFSEKPPIDSCVASGVD